MPTQTIEWLSKQRATYNRVHRYLRGTGRLDAAEQFALKSGHEFFLHNNETTAEAAIRFCRIVGPPPSVKEKLAAEVKTMLHASRDAMRIRWHAMKSGVPGGRAYDPREVRFVASDGYFGEAFGVLRAMEVIGWGEFGAVNTPDSLNGWFCRLENEVLAEEHFGGSGECDHCLQRYGRDDAGRKRS